MCLEPYGGNRYFQEPKDEKHWVFFFKNSNRSGMELRKWSWNINTKVTIKLAQKL